jgi:prevent-host-death family protein
MREVQASEAKTHLLRLLDAVERGETIAITRHGRRIARIVPEEKGRQEQAEETIANIRARGGRRGSITGDEILYARGVGRK